MRVATLVVEGMNDGQQAIRAAGVKPVIDQLHCRQRTQSRTRHDQMRLHLAAGPALAYSRGVVPTAVIQGLLPVGQGRIA